MKRLFVRETDYVRDTTVVDVRYIPIVRKPRAGRSGNDAAERDQHEAIV